MRDPKSSVSKAWVPEIGHGYYKNPIIYADYSDPDVCRVGDDYYMVASSFITIPGIPILHSNDLVNWRIIGHALPKQPPYHHFSKPQHGRGVWAPAIRHHNGEFYIYYPDPDYGIYMTKSKKITGPWSKPVLVIPGSGLEDPCPFWDNDGKGYLIHAFVGSRRGTRNVLVLNRLSNDGSKIINTGRIVYDGTGVDPDVEGPKMYKRKGYYYIFAPAGGVSHGWQIVLRSKHVYGPYQRRKVMEQGHTDINGPHQGAWVTTPKGASWFIHFRDLGVYGRVTMLEPIKWKNGWPIIGKSQGNGVGEPVTKYKMPDVGKKYPVATPQTSDEFNGDKLGLQWQWQANTRQNWYYMFPAKGDLRLYCQALPNDFKNYWDVPNILLQKFPAPAFTATSKLTFNPQNTGDKVGFIIMGSSYAYLALTKKADGIYLTYEICEQADHGKPDKIYFQKKISESTIYFKTEIKEGVLSIFSYSLDGHHYRKMKETFRAEKGRWIGAKVGMYCTSTGKAHNSGFADFDWFRIAQNKK